MATTLAGISIRPWPLPSCQLWQRPCDMCDRIVLRNNVQSWPARIDLDMACPDKPFVPSQRIPDSLCRGGHRTTHTAGNWLHPDQCLCRRLCFSISRSHHRALFVFVRSSHKPFLDVLTCLAFKFGSRFNGQLEFYVSHVEQLLIGT